MAAEAGVVEPAGVRGEPLRAGATGVADVADLSPASRSEAAKAASRMWLMWRDFAREQARGIAVFAAM